VTRRRLPVVAALIMYRAGSLYEPHGKSGLAHLTEHMMFRGTPTRPQGDIDRLIGRVGGANNAVTTSDHATYYFTLPSEHWATPLAIEADRMWNCDLDETTFGTERRVALEERAMLDDDPEALAFEAVDSLAFEGHPYEYPVVGLSSDLEGMTVDDVRDFYDDRYRPAEAVLAVVGDVREDQVAAEVERLFAKGAQVPRASAVTARLERTDGEAVARRATAAGVDARPGARGSGPRRTTLSGASPVPRVVLGYMTPEAMHEDTAALELLCAVLSSGRSSVLYRELVDGSGVATEVSAYKLPQVEPGLLYVGATLNAGESPERCEDRLTGLIGDIVRDGVSEAAMERARNLTLVDVMIGRETCLGVAGAVAFWESLGGWRLGRDHEERLSRVTSDDVRRVAEAYLDPDGRSSAWLVP